MKHLEKSFFITDDHLDEVNMSFDNKQKLRAQGYNIPFLLYDDDDILYYSGLLHEDEEDEFTPLDWAMNEAGCVYIKIYNKQTKKFEIL